ncbi:expressed protein [Chlorella variabilis]|uniref:Expressed protein n=1 Tax=Chlorella variabilis TaxID=554065 RepID=E1Z3Q9_CHLVA|nr:expressed protein [Chlorella variabilis]EFN59219.1 expressed protein [Chlorella variabilis]|eukprot:XP_005851321.1 expressed protein [Chlorella variabilis]
MLAMSAPSASMGQSSALSSRLAVPKQLAAGMKSRSHGVQRQERRQRNSQGRVVSWQITEVMRHGGGTSTIEPVPTASITFKTRRRLQFGQVLKLVGSHKSMGAWDCDRAPAMTWVEGDYWLLTLDLPAGEHEFKVAAAHSGGGCSADWESGPNRVVQVPYAEAAVRGAFTVVWEWGDPKTLAEEEHDMEELKQLMEALEQGWAAGGGNGQQSAQLQELSGVLEAERIARRAAEAERDDLRRQAEASAAEAAALVRNSTTLRAEFEQMARELGNTHELRAQLQAERDGLSRELSASYEQRTALQKERDALAEQVWRAGEQSASFQPEREALERRLRSAEEQVARLQGECDRLGRELWTANEQRAALQSERDSLKHQMHHSNEPSGQLRQERDALANQLRTAREQLDAAQRDVRRLEEESRNSGRTNHKEVLKSAPASRAHTCRAALSALLTNTNTNTY